MSDHSLVYYLEEAERSVFMIYSSFAHKKLFYSLAQSTI